MELRVLRYFIAIVKDGNISSAAKRLHISQPALSRQIMDLEMELGVTLFERGHRQIKLTQEGYYLYERAQDIVAMVNTTEYSLQSRDVISGTLDIGGGESPAMKIVMETINDILQEHPEVQVNLVSGNANSIEKRLESGLIEFGVVMGTHNLQNYNSLVLPQKNRWGILLRKDEPLAQKDVIAPEDLIGHALITSYETNNGDAFREWAGSLVNQLTFVGHYNLINNATLLVKTGSCFALTYENLVQDDSLVFCPLYPEVTDLNTLIWNRDHQLSNLSRLFIDKIQKKVKTTK
ncbi:LysR family transcriptional regulator [Limosilactobacillus sp. WF-MT5-A]|uniref:LysR family transcriptional regulator n=1 Tax=Limosilactobacillus agrestis TaxID=2759748 RepID=UPI0015FDD7FC|nr:LysR family transcriptional regulator [Limosilactobacillus agrestis]MBB1099602.1 LysR family transcriptional regulator [Limosilactobacillus agrestis]MCD7127232.1 LysR family transcriptional regulator [Limosilactobacillus agrestis]